MGKSKMHAAFAVGLGMVLALAAALARTGDGGTAASRPAADEQADAVTFDMRKVPLGDLLAKRTNPELRQFCIGARVALTPIPPDQRARYPKLVSDNALQGTLTVFLSGGAMEDEPNSTGSPAAPKTSGHAFFVDETAGTGKGYDRLFFDVDGDGNPMNDPPAKTVAKSPLGETSWPGPHFEVVTIQAPAGAAGELSLAPSMCGRQPEICFTSTSLRKGDIRIGKRKYEARLGHSYVLGWRFDDPQTTTLLLTEITRLGRRMEYWWGCDKLGQMRCVNGQWYSFSASPAGDKLTVHKYAGELGVLRFGPGNRDVRNVTGYGALETREHAVRIARPSDAEPEPPPAPGNASPATQSGRTTTDYFGPDDKVDSLALPAGDYLPVLVSVQMGRLGIEISDNYHADGGPRKAPRDKRVYGIHIARNKPYVLDFSNKPDVLFAMPYKAASLRPGEEMNVAAVLIDPVLDVMIRGLRDTTRHKTRKLSGGESFEEPLSLDPMVTITDSTGKKVAGGPMPFG